MTYIFRPGAYNITAAESATITQPGGGVVANGLLNALIAYWPLNEVNGDALDLHTNALHLTQGNNPGNTPGLVYPLSRTLDGASQYFTRASEALLQTGNVDFTIAIWVNVTAITLFGMFVAKSNPDEYELRTRAAFADLEFYINGQSVSPGVPIGTIVPGAWTMVLIGYNAATGKMFFSQDNAPLTERVALPAPVNAIPFYIGRRSDGFYLNAKVGPVAYWKSAAGGGGVLDAAKRATLYNAGAGLPYASFTL